jgi:hypothetical protein
MICNQFNHHKPQRVLFCGVDHQPIWHLLRQTCGVDGLSPSHWCTENIGDAKMVDAVLQNMVCAQDDPCNACKQHSIVFFSDADLMKEEVQIALARAMEGKVYTTYMTETPVNMRDVCFVLVTEKSIYEMKKQMHWLLKDQMTSVFEPI